jgi:hypothetical protein
MDPTLPSGLGDSLFANSAKQLSTFMSAVFMGSSLGGLARMLLAEEELPLRKVVGCMLLSGVAGVIVALLLWDYLAENRALLAGVSLLSGVGGSTTIDFLFVLIRNKAQKLLGTSASAPSDK